MVQFYSIHPNAQHVKQGSNAEWGAAQGADWRKAQSGSDLQPVRSSGFTQAVQTALEGDLVTLQSETT